MTLRSVEIPIPEKNIFKPHGRERSKTKGGIREQSHEHYLKLLPKEILKWPHPKETSV